MAEAMALGVPVISTSAGSIPELIENNKTGVLVQAGSADGLSMAIRSLAHDVVRRREIGRAAQAKVRAEYNWDAVAARFESVYLAALGAS